MDSGKGRQSGGSSVEAKSRQNRGPREVVRLKEEKHVHTSSVNSARKLIKNRKKQEDNVNEGKFLIMFSNVDVLSPDKLIELNAQLKEMEKTPQVIALQEVKPKHYRYERITTEYNLEGYDIIEQNLLNKEGRGDFNLPQINWSNYTSVMGLNDVGTMFIEKVRDYFLTQHIEEITRIRGDSTGNTLDLLFSNEESIVEDIKLESPLGKSDHACIYFHCDIQEMEDKSKKQVYMYEKADYLLMKQWLTMDWIQYLSLEPDIESKWNKFKGKFQAVIDECVPKKIIRGLRVSRKRTNEKLPMNRKLWAKVKKEQRLWERLKIMKTKFNERACTREMHLETEKEYRRLNNQVRWETRNILKRKEQEITKNVKANPKVFWKYVQTKTRTKARIADLYKDEEKVQKTVNDQEKADMREADTTRGNSKKIYKTRARLNLRRHSFTSRVVNNWNGLPEWVVNVETVEKFEAKLDKYWKNQQQVYNYRAQISATHSHRLSREEAIEPLPKDQLSPTPTHTLRVPDWPRSPPVAQDVQGRELRRRGRGLLGGVWAWPSCRPLLQYGVTPRRLPQFSVSHHVRQGRNQWDSDNDRHQSSPPAAPPAAPPAGGVRSRTRSPAGTTTPVSRGGEARPAQHGPRTLRVAPGRTPADRGDGEYLSVVGLH
ncbi:putative Endonuclease-reverse transcriptase-containing protein 12 [Homarus americanus]|uniref:Putative Endonuclease-reverse transcriptase-containing protein 12 n=1 Tax=Homarus americanus TaxID=6706 RepID=A0A8J5JT48_HOMAM|nr:putative Endonuclease-reverse transcriptase-containing protein 12 [Homarus americanus]